MAFAAGWTPCVGPVLAGTLALAAVQGNAARGSVLLFVYSMGLGVPFLLLGLGVGRLMGALDILKRHHDTISLVSGVIKVSIGLLLVSGLWVRIMSPVLRLVNGFEPPIWFSTPTRRRARRFRVLTVLPKVRLDLREPRRSNFGRESACVRACPPHREAVGEIAGRLHAGSSRGREGWVLIARRAWPATLSPSPVT